MDPKLLNDLQPKISYRNIPHLFLTFSPLQSVTFFFFFTHLFLLSFSKGDSADLSHIRLLPSWSFLMFLTFSWIVVAYFYILFASCPIISVISRLPRWSIRFGLKVSLLRIVCPSIFVNSFNFSWTKNQNNNNKNLSSLWC